MTIPKLLSSIGTPYLIFIDADLIILDCKFNIYGDVVSKYPNADIILAADAIGMIESCPVLYTMEKQNSFDFRCRYCEHGFYDSPQECMEYRIFQKMVDAERPSPASELRPACSEYATNEPR